LAVDVRLIAAANADLPALAEAGRFRSDLLDRLAFDVVTVPPLRARAEDIPLLAEHFARAMTRTLGRDTFAGFSHTAMARLQAHSWPGNVRELKNVIHRAFIMADEEITPRSLPREVGGESGAVRSLHFQVGASISDVEHRLIMATLDAYAGNKRKTADVLGVSLKTLYNRLNTYRVGEV
jgi:DNA-binding NtrC family response regulator